MKLRKMLRSEVFQRSRFYCEYCGVDLLSHPRLFESLVLDHLVPRSLGGGNTVDNLRVSCAACDRIKRNAPTKSVADVQAHLAAFRVGFEAWRERYREAFRLKGGVA